MDGTVTIPGWEYAFMLVMTFLGGWKVGDVIFGGRR